MSAAVILLIGAYFALTKIDTKKPVETPNPTAETISIFKTDKEKIVSMTLKTPKSEFTFAKKDKNWVVAGWENIKLTQSKVDSLAYDFAMLNADTLISENGNLSDYGLDKPLATPNITLSDGTEKKFILGNLTPTGNGYYFKMNDDAKIYTISSTTGEDFIKDLAGYRDTTIATVDAKSLVQFKILRNNANIEIKLKDEKELAKDTYGMNSWKMTSPYQLDVNTDVVGKQIFEKLNFEVKDFVEDAPASYTKYGLDKPKYVISFTEKDKSPITIELGNEKEGAIYARLVRSKEVYTIDAQTVAYKDIDPLSMVNTLIYLQQIDKVTAITLTADNNTYVLKINGTGDTATYSINDVSAKTELFKNVYQEIIGLSLRGVVTGDVNGQPICKYVFSFNDGRADDVIELIPYGDRYVAVKINGKANYYVMREQVNNIIAKIKEFSEKPNE